MKEKMLSLKENKKAILILILLLMMICVGISYAYWKLTLQQTETNLVNTGCFEIVFTEKDDIQLDKAYPIKDYEASSLTPYTFTIENTCDSPVSYQINLETMSQGSDVKVLPDEYIKANLIEMDSTNTSTNNLTSEYEVEKTIENALKAYKLDTGIIQGKEKKTFELRLWLDYDTPAVDEVMNAIYNGKISITSSYLAIPSNMIMAKDFTIDLETGEGDINPDTMQIISDSFWQHNLNIKTITFESTLTPKDNAAYTYDISANQDGSVMAYLVENGTLENEALGTIPAYDMYIQSTGKVYANYDSSWLFGMFINLTEINNLQNLDTSYVTNMNRMFFYDMQLAGLDSSSFNTSNVTDMGYMFAGLESLTELDISSFDTANVTDMSGMFAYMGLLTNLNLGNFDTSNVTDMSNMFYGMLTLTKLDISHFDTSNVTDMNNMFASLESLTELDISSFDTSNVIDMSWMFDRLKSLTELDISSFDTANVIDMRGMFSGMSSLAKLDLSSFDTLNVTNMGYMFSDMESLAELDLSDFDTSNVTDMSYMFSDMESLAELDLSDFDTSNVTDMSWMFSNMYSLTTLDLSRFDTSNVTDMGRMFNESSKLTNITYGNNFVYANNANVLYMFINCPANKPTDPSWEGVDLDW